MARSQAELDRWIEGSEEEILDPGLPIVDAHHHMWVRPPEKYGFEEVLADAMRGHNVRATVFMECTAMYKPDGPEPLRSVGETEYVNGVAAMSYSGILGPRGICAGIVSATDFRYGDEVATVLEAHIRAGGGRFRGMRQQSQHDEHIGSLARRAPPPGLLLDAKFRRGFACLAPLGLTFDAYLYHTQLGELADLAAAFPGTGIVLDHAGTPLGIGPYAGRRDEVYAAWAESMRALARHDNVSVKIGGLGMPHLGFGFDARERPPSSAEMAAAWRPYVEFCIEAFGPDRCMFESNFPVDKQSGGYVALWNAFKRITASYATVEKSALYWTTACRVYRLDEASFA
ncbi:MAG TPA: amidohydrolase family protein [Stellaceae bacterium]|nr:amidohydrolase family protein [Stellaceae bacterium]